MVYLIAFCGCLMFMRMMRINFLFLPSHLLYTDPWCRAILFLTFLVAHFRELTHSLEMVEK